MGNRANLVLPDFNLSLYLHWNGGPESVAAFLQYAQEIGLRDDDYYPPRLAQIIGNFLDGTLSIGLSSGITAYDGCIYNYQICVEGLDEPEIIHEGQRYTLSELVKSVQDHPYWQADANGQTILEQVRAANAPHFPEHLQGR